MPANVKNAVQILAIHESRKFFRPVMWTASRTKRLIWNKYGCLVSTLTSGALTAERHIGNIGLITMIDRVIAKTRLSFDQTGIRTA